ncbi:TrpB-like pyridoxal phosphate-dependent enzyme [Acidobacteriota bacterium]
MKRFMSRNQDYLPTNFYNLKADLPEPPKPPLHPGTKEPITPDDLLPLFPAGLIQHEGSQERHIPIPQKVLDAFSVFRPTPLVYASALKNKLQTPAHILYKYEGAGPTGSHKSNTALVQAYLAAEEGIKTLSTETGAGQWGSALAHAGSEFGVDVDVFMVRISFRQKPGRRILMEMYGANVQESPSNTTDAGKKFFEIDPNHPGSLGIAISEAVEMAAKTEGVKYSLGSVLDSVLMHQSIIGLEAEEQLKEIGLTPDVVIGCVGGGSNFSGLAFPFIRHNLSGERHARFVAVEPEVCPTLTTGELKYDFGDSIGMTPLLYMHSLGMDFVPPPIHAGGLRYHGMAPLVSHLVHKGIVDPVAYSEEKIFKAAELFLRTEGILPAPESAHAIAAAVDEALLAKEENKEKVILLNLSGHGFLDINAYEKNSKKKNKIC